MTESDGPVSREQAAAATSIGRTLAAYHLDKLADAGLLTTRYERPAGRGGPGAGRPAKLYTPATQEMSVTLPPRTSNSSPNCSSHPSSRMPAEQCNTP